MTVVRSGLRNLAGDLARPGRRLSSTSSLWGEMGKTKSDNLGVLALVSRSLESLIT